MKFLRATRHSRQFNNVRVTSALPPEADIPCRIRHVSKALSSFRDCAGNVSNFPREITETALAHVIGDKAEQAYRRSDALEKRRKLMDAWSAYCGLRLRQNIVQLCNFLGETVH